MVSGKMHAFIQKIIKDFLCWKNSSFFFEIVSNIHRRKIRKNEEFYEKNSKTFHLFIL